MKNALIGKSKSVYRILLSLYPKDYKHEFSREMEYVFSESLKDAYSEHGEYGLVSLWIRTIIDTFKTIIKEHVENQKGGVNMKNKKTNIFKNVDLVRIVGIVALLMLFPLVANYTIEGWDWDVRDFAIIAVLIFSTALTLEVIAKNFSNFTYKVAASIAAILVFLLIWMELAVGVFGTPFAGS